MRLANLDRCLMAAVVFALMFLTQSGLRGDCENACIQVQYTVYRDKSNPVATYWIYYKFPDCLPCVYPNSWCTKPEGDGVPASKCKVDNTFTQTQTNSYGNGDQLCPWIMVGTPSAKCTDCFVDAPTFTYGVLEIPIGKPWVCMQ